MGVRTEEIEELGVGCRWMRTWDSGSCERDAGERLKLTLLLLTHNVVTTNTNSNSCQHGLETGSNAIGTSVRPLDFWHPKMPPKCPR